MIATTIDTLAQFASGECDVPKFESWLYTNSELENEIGAEAYLELISLDYTRIESRLRGRTVAAVAVESLAPAAWSRKSRELRDQLDRDIRLAFKGVSRGEGTTLREAAVLDDRGSEIERTDARRLDPEFGWENVSSGEVERYPILFLDAEGFRYYVPAYMLWAVNVCADPLSDSLGSLVFCLVHSDADRFALFTREQKRAIARFLWYIALRHDFLRDDVYEGLANRWAQSWEGD